MFDFYINTNSSVFLGDNQLPPTTMPRVLALMSKQCSPDTYIEIVWFYVRKY